MKQKKILITDLDGTLLDENYEWRRAEREIEELKRRGIPIVFCSAKTREEQREIREEMGVKDPYIVEDGSAIVIPEESELYGVAETFPHRHDREKGEILIVLGDDYGKVVSFLDELGKPKLKLKYYARMSEDEISKVTGLSEEKARLAKNREFSETLVEWNEEDLEKIREKFNVEVGGRFAHVYGKNADKGKAIDLLRKLYERAGYSVWTLGVGNHYTDIPMLKAVDQPAIVRNPDGWIEADIPNLYRARGVATEGWVEVVRKFLLPDL